MLDLSETQHPGAASVLAEPERLATLIRSAIRIYTRGGFRFADWRSCAWAAHVSSPYRDEVERVSQAMGCSGAFLLNYSYEWGCTTGVVTDHAAGGMTLLRTLDWPFDELGRTLIAIRQRGAAGAYVSITWPGFVGVLTGAAPGRFAAAINQPPLPLPMCGRAMGWLAARWLVGRSRAMPPAHLLRLAFDSCCDFAAAVALIREVPICMPAIFTLAGPRDGEAIVIERTRSAAFIADEPAAANHWATPQGPPGKPRNESSGDRRAAMCALLTGAPDWSLGWVRAPILQSDTRLAMMANPRTGRIVVQGWEGTGPATEILDLH